MMRLNWTFMELKYALMSRKTWAWLCLNWTFMELKYQSYDSGETRQGGLNWTFMELKSCLISGKPSAY